MNQDERNEKIEEYGRGFDLLSAALGEVPREAWQFKPRPREWSVHEIVVHMADSEAMGVLRVRKLIAEPGSTVMPYEESKWAETLNYQAQSADDALQLFKLLRQVTYRLLKTLPDRIFAHTVVHPELAEPYTFEQWLNIYARHVPEHIQQLKKTHSVWRELKK